MKRDGMAKAKPGTVRTSRHVPQVRPHVFDVVKGVASLRDAELLALAAPIVRELVARLIKQPAGVTVEIFAGRAWKQEPEDLPF